ncbi:HTH-type transcriptional repressor CsqR [Burkholderiaceae bacterium]|nr:HTH-type transcriptional repressor CsqR [Burkholderiaceae bacterium]
MARKAAPREADLLADERRQRIAELLAEHHKLRAQELVQRFRVSDDTIRRDLAEMAEQGLLRRVHGGALPAGAPVPPRASWNQRLGIDETEKVALVEALLPQFHGGELLIIDSGTTNGLLARRLPRSLPFTVITTSPEVALALCDHPRCEVIMPGGRLQPATASFCGPQALRLIEGVQADLCVLGVCAVSAAAGISVHEFEEVAVKQAMLAHATRSIALATAAKVGTRLAYRVAPAEQLGSLLTTADERHEGLDEIRRLGVPVSCVAV